MKKSRLLVVTIALVAVLFSLFAVSASAEIVTKEEISNLEKKVDTLAEAFLSLVKSMPTTLQQPTTPAPAEAEPTQPVVRTTSETGPSYTEIYGEYAGKYTPLEINRETFAKGNMVYIPSGDVLLAVPPQRGMVVKEEELRLARKFGKFRWKYAYGLQVVEQIDDLPVSPDVPMILPKFQSVEHLLAYGRIAGIHLVALDVANIFEMEKGRIIDEPVGSKSTFLVQNTPGDARLEGGHMILNINKKMTDNGFILYNRDYTDFQSVCYAATIVCEFPVLKGTHQIDHKSAKPRGPKYVIPAGEMFTLFFGAKESTKGKDNGSEKVIMIHPSRHLEQEIFPVR